MQHVNREMEAVFASEKERLAEIEEEISNLQADIEASTESDSPAASSSSSGPLQLPAAEPDPTPTPPQVEPQTQPATDTQQPSAAAEQPVMPQPDQAAILRAEEAEQGEVPCMCICGRRAH